jgi:hypothetical protein
VCTRYLFGLRRFDHISEFSRGILGYTLFEYLELRLACFINKIGLVGALSYLSSLLVLGRFSRHRLITVQRPAPSTSLRGDSTVYRGIRLWNVFFFKVFILNYAQYNIKIDPKSYTYKFFYCECVDEVFNYPKLKLLIQIFLKTISKLLY